LPTTHVAVIAVGCAIALALAFRSTSWDVVDLAAVALAAAWAIAAIASPLRVDVWPTLACVAITVGLARIREPRVALSLVAGLAALGALVLAELVVLSLHAQLKGGDRRSVYQALAAWGGYPELGFLGVIILPLVLGICLHAKRLDTALASALVALTSGAGVLLSFSRAAWVASAVGGGLVILTTGRRRATIALLLVAGLVAVAWLRVPLVATYGARLTMGAGNPAVDDRAQAWRMATEVWRARWLAGWGPNAYRQAFAARFPSPTEFARFHAHNQLLQVAVETGIIGAGAALWFGGALLALACRGLTSTSGVMRGVRAGLVASLVAVAVRFQFDFFDPAGEPKRVMILLSCIAGLAVALGRLGPGVERERVMETAST
jgi:O-antigen ligase